MFKNLLWFSRQPADERETVVLTKAYQRGMLALWVGLIAVWLVAMMIPSNTSITMGSLAGTVFDVTHLTVKTILMVLLFGSILAGWTAVKDEELEYAPLPKRPKAGILGLVGLSVLILLAGAGLVLWQTSLEYVAIVGVMFALYLLCAWWAWRMMIGYTLQARLLGALIFPLPTIGWLVSREFTVPVRLLSAVSALVLFCFACLGAAIPLFTKVAMPVAYNGWTMPGEVNSSFHRIIHDYRDKAVKIGDVVFIPNVPGGYPYAYVRQIDGDKITVEVAEGESQSVTSARPGEVVITHPTHFAVITKDEIEAKVLTNVPLNALVNLYH